MNPDAIDDAEILLAGRGTPEERLAEVGKVFAELAKKKDEEAARVILAQLEGRDPSDPKVLNSLDASRVGIIAEGVSEIRRGDIWDNIITAASAIAGVAAGYLSHKALDVRVAGVPVNGVAGVVGIAAGAWLDTTLTTRNVLFTGGSCFASGSVLYALTHPAQIGPLQANPANNNG